MHRTTADEEVQSMVLSLGSTMPMLPFEWPQKFSTFIEIIKEEPMRGIQNSYKSQQ